VAAATAVTRPVRDKCWSHCCEASRLAGGCFLAEGRDNQQQGGTTATSAQGDRRNLQEQHPSIQQDDQQEHELTVWERLFIAAEISAELNVTVPAQISW